MTFNIFPFFSAAGKALKSGVKAGTVVLDATAKSVDSAVTLTDKAQAYGDTLAGTFSTAGAKAKFLLEHFTNYPLAGALVTDNLYAAFKAIYPDIIHAATAVALSNELIAQAKANGADFSVLQRPAIAPVPSPLPVSVPADDSADDSASPLDLLAKGAAPSNAAIPGIILGSSFKAEETSTSEIIQAVCSDLDNNPNTLGRYFRNTLEAKNAESCIFGDVLIYTEGFLPDGVFHPYLENSDVARLMTDNILAYKGNVSTNLEIEARETAIARATGTIFGIYHLLKLCRNSSAPFIKLKPRTDAYVAHLDKDKYDFSGFGKEKYLTGDAANFEEFLRTFANQYFFANSIYSL